jgi:hypothetical protein
LPVVGTCYSNYWEIQFGESQCEISSGKKCEALSEKLQKEKKKKYVG